jgi:hypothetical protein
MMRASSSIGSMLSAGHGLTPSRGLSRAALSRQMVGFECDFSNLLSYIFR